MLTNEGEEDKINDLCYRNVRLKTKKNYKKKEKRKRQQPTLTLTSRIS